MNSRLLRPTLIATLLFLTVGFVFVSPRGPASHAQGGQVQVTAADPMSASQGTVNLNVKVTGKVTASIVAQTPSAGISHFDAGVRANENNDFDLAIEEFTMAIEINAHPLIRVRSKQLLRPTKLPPTQDQNTVTVSDPFTAAAYANRCFARYRKGDFTEAVADCDQAIRINPRLAMGYLNRGAARRAVGDAAAALVDLNKAIEINPNLTDALDCRGDLRKHLGDVDGALSDLNRAIVLAPGNKWAYFHRGHARIAKRDLDGAVADFNQAIKLQQDFAVAYHGRGIARVLKNQLEQAIGDFSHALELNPKLALAYENRGFAFLIQGKEAEAMQDFTRCLTIDPSLKEDLDKRVKVAKELGLIR